MQGRIAPLAAAAALVLPPAQGVAHVLGSQPKKKRVSTAWKKVLGPAVSADRWGEIQVLLVVKKVTTTYGKRKTVKRTIRAVRLPVYPKNGASHTIGINRRVLPVLAQEVLREQFRTRIEIISEATDTSLAFDQSLQVALANARRV
jgi:hypothetical protein